jgi:hypothetical protein
MREAVVSCPAKSATHKNITTSRLNIYYTKHPDDIIPKTKLEEAL